MKPHLSAIFAACLLVCGACGGGGGGGGGGERPPVSPNPETPVSPTPPPAGTVIRGSERLGWDEAAPSLAAAQGYLYVLYVDGAPRSMTDIRCGAATGTGYACSGQLPPLVNGAHVLELAAVDNGVEGPRSTSFRVTVNPSASVPLPAGLLMANASRIACLDAAVADCYDAVTIATGLGAVSDLAVVSDGRAFFIENSRAVRVLTSDGLSPMPALAADDDGQHLVSMALSPDFQDTHFVYVGSIEERRAGAEFSVRRYREVGGVLGQGAALVSGLPVAPGDRVPLAIDTQEQIYVALPAAPESLGRLSAFAYNGNVLRFAADGGLPAEQASPIFTRGYDSPSAMVYDAGGQRLWLGGSSSHGSSPLVILSNLGSAHPSVVSTSRASFDQTSHEGSLKMPAVALRSHDSDHEVWLTEGTAYRGVISGGAVQRLQSVDTGLGRLSAIAALRGNGLLAVLSLDNDASEIVRLVPRSPAQDH